MKNLKILIGVSIVVLVLTVLGFFVAKDSSHPGSSAGIVGGDVVGSRSIICGGVEYISDIVTVDGPSGDGSYAYFNELYRAPRNKENFLVRLRPPSENSLAVFLPLTAPKQDCDRIFFTVAVLETDTPIRGIFEWGVGEQNMREIAVSTEFDGARLPYAKERSFVSPDGTRTLTAKQDPLDSYPCVTRTLTVLDLIREEIDGRITLPQEEALDDGTSDLEPYCNGLNFGWVDDSTVYYDVYDATTDHPRPFEEQRTTAVE